MDLANRLCFVENRLVKVLELPAFRDFYQPNSIRWWLPLHELLIIIFAGIQHLASYENPSLAANEYGAKSSVFVIGWVTRDAYFFGHIRGKESYG